MFLFHRKASEPLPEDVLREHYVFSGRVQNIGFRYEMESAARQHRVTGWVRNLDNGKVAAELQGTRRQIDAVLEHMHSVPRIHITDTDRQSVRPVPGEKNFAEHY